MNEIILYLIRIAASNVNNNNNNERLSKVFIEAWLSNHNITKYYQNSTL